MHMVLGKDQLESRVPVKRETGWLQSHRIEALLTAAQKGLLQERVSV